MVDGADAATPSLPSYQLLWQQLQHQTLAILYKPSGCKLLQHKQNHGCFSCSAETPAEMGAPASKRI